MKQFDFDKHPDIDIVAWDKNGECWSAFEKGVTEWSTGRLREYDIDPTTEGFDWTKSKKIRPTQQLVGYIHADVRLQERIAELETICNRTNGMKNDLAERVIELEKENAKLKRDLDHGETFYEQCKITRDDYYKELLQWREQWAEKPDYTEKLIYFWGQNFLIRKADLLKGLSKGNYKSDSTSFLMDLLIDRCNEDTELYRQAIERIVKNEV